MCAGYGGLELALQFLGLEPELLWFSEIDSNAAKVVEARFGSPPNLGDLTKIGDAPKVDVVTAGFPCQPVSEAGSRKGVFDDRWLIDDVCKIASRSGAELLILENVIGILNANNGFAMARTVSALAENGFSAEWVGVRAPDIGAPHRRLRWFCVAYTDSARCGKYCREFSMGTQRSSIEYGRDGLSSFGPYATAIKNWSEIVGRPPPTAIDLKNRLNPQFVEWMMGLDAGWVTEIVSARTSALSLLGNGVVPQQAALAISNLLQRIQNPIEAEKP